MTQLLFLATEQPMSLHIYTSNRMENLVSALADLLAVPLTSVLTPELIVLQSKGMQRWLAMELATRFGVWSNCRYPFPNALAQELMASIIPDAEVDDLFSRDLMQWRIFGCLPELMVTPGFELPARYLADDATGTKRFQLAVKIADNFDQYTLYRPDILQRWEEGGLETDEERWQARLWLELVQGTTGMHRGSLQRQFCQQVAYHRPDEKLLPQRITVFGVSYLPAYHLQIIAQAARLTEVHLFLLSPTREYWSDILPARSLARLSLAERALRIEGNPLLASLGRLGRDFSEMTTELTGVAHSDVDLYQEPAQETLLGRVQADILNLQGDADLHEKLTVSPHDRSIQIHSCHSRMREIEVLYDQLLAMIEQDPSIEPRHILVMTPDIEAYTPYITAVFGTERTAGQKLPFSIADRKLAAEGEVSSVIQQLLQLPGSRFSIAQVLDILSLGPVQRSFGFSDEDLALVRHWLVQTRVRWGQDQHDRVRHGLPPYRANSWSAGLERLLLGYAMADDGNCMFRGVVPFDDLEGQQSVLLGRLIDFFKNLGAVARDLEQTRHLTQWASELQRIIQGFVADDDSVSQELELIAGLLDSLGEHQQKSGLNQPVGFEVIKAWLISRLEQEQKGLGFMTGGITFCAMLPMRSIPFRVIVMIGMHDGAFPRQNREDGFNLIAAHPRIGDRSLRDEDRYLFLETILSARDYLYLSYIGQSQRDNSELPPSVLIGELQDALDRRFRMVSGTPLEDHLVTRHRLQPFNCQYFSNDPCLFSYSTENLSAATEQTGGGRDQTLFITSPLKEPGSEWRELSLARLLQFYGNPAQYFVENRLGIRLAAEQAALDEHEPFQPETLDAYQFKQQLLQHLLDSKPAEHVQQRVRSLGVLPPAGHGELLFNRYLEDVRPFAEQVRSCLTASAELPVLEIDLQIAGFRLYGRLRGIHQQALYRYRCAGFHGRDQIRAWIEHLLLVLCRPETYPDQTVLLMSDRQICFRPPEDPAGELTTLLNLYWQGLSEPLPFFPKTSDAYANKQAWDLDRAVKAWNPQYFSGIGEGENPYNRLCFGTEPPFSQEFDRISRLVMEPLMACRSELS